MSMKTPDTPTWTYRAFKAGVMFWLVLGRGERARDLLDRMLQRWPDDAYVLSSRAHLHAQAGRRDAAIADAQALVHAHPAAQRGRLVQPGLPARSGRAAGRGRTGVPPRRRNRSEARPCLVRPGPDADPPGPARRGREGAGAQHQAAADEPVRLVPAGPCAHGPPAPDEARKIIRHLKGFEPKVAAQLERETGLAA
jgi:hypothetical protein